MNSNEFIFFNNEDFVIINNNSATENYSSFSHQKGKMFKSEKLFC